MGRWSDVRSSRVGETESELRQSLLNTTEYLEREVSLLTYATNYGPLVISLSHLPRDSEPQILLINPSLKPPPSLPLLLSLSLALSLSFFSVTHTPEPTAIPSCRRLLVIVIIGFRLVCGTSPYSSPPLASEGLQVLEEYTETYLSATLLRRVFQLSDNHISL